MQVLDTNAEVIPGLYAAGNCGGSVFADGYYNLTHGMACGRALTFARHAVNHIAGTKPSIYQHPSLGGAGSKPAPLSERDAEAPSSPKCSTASINSCWECTSSFM